MIFDQQTMFSDAQAITGDAVSTNTVDLGPINAGIVRDIGNGKPIPIRVQVVDDFDKLTSLNVSLQVDDNDAFSSPKTVWTSGEIALASLKAGYAFTIDYVPRGTDERYLRLSYDVTGTDPDNGAITAGITMGNPSHG